MSIFFRWNRTQIYSFNKGMLCYAIRLEYICKRDKLKNIFMNIKHISYLRCGSTIDNFIDPIFMNVKPFCAS